MVMVLPGTRQHHRPHHPHLPHSNARLFRFHLPTVHYPLKPSHPNRSLKPSQKLLVLLLRISTQKKKNKKPPPQWITLISPFLPFLSLYPLHPRHLHHLRRFHFFSPPSRFTHLHQPRFLFAVLSLLAPFYYFCCFRCLQWIR